MIRDFVVTQIFFLKGFICVPDNDKNRYETRRFELQLHHCHEPKIAYISLINVPNASHCNFK